MANDAPTPQPDVTPQIDPANPAGITIPTAPAPAAPSTIGGNAPSGPAPLQKESFRQGLAAGVSNIPYTTDAEGNVYKPAPAVKPSVKGVLGRILMGALEGASAGAAAETPEGAKGAGAAFSAGANAARKARIAADDRQRAIAQQNFENKEAAKKAAVQQQLETAQTALVTQNMHQSEDLHPGVLRAQQNQNEAAELQLRGARQKLLEDGINFKANMAQLGIDPTPFTDHGPELTAQIPGLVKGSVRAVHNGQEGEANGVDIYPTAALNQPLTTPVTYNTYDGALDKNGVPIPTPHTITPDGKVTANDYLNKYFAGQAQLVKIAQKTHADMTMQQLQAETKAKEAGAEKDIATAHLTEAQAKNLEEMGAAPPANFQLNPNAFSMSAPDLQQDLQKQGAKIPRDFASLYGTAHYKVDPNTFPNRVTKGTGQMDKQSAISYIRTYINPNFDESNYSAVKKMETEFANPDPSHAGGNLIAFNTATAHLGQLYEAAQALGNGDVRVINRIANNLGVQVGQSPVLTFDAIKGALAGEIGKTFKGTAADIPEREGIEKSIESANSPQQAQDVAKTYAHLMLSKVGSTVSHYVAYTGELPPEAIQPAAAQVYQMMGIDTNSVLPAGVKAPVGGTGNQNPQTNTRTWTNKAGQSFQLDANNNFQFSGFTYHIGEDGLAHKVVPQK